MLKIINEKLSAKETESLVEQILTSTSPPPERKAKPRKRIKGYIKDLKLLFNTLDRSVKLLNQAGYSAIWAKQEQNDEMEITIKIKQK